MHDSTSFYSDKIGITHCAKLRLKTPFFSYFQDRYLLMKSRLTSQNFGGGGGGGAKKIDLYNVPTALNMQFDTTFSFALSAKQISGPDKVTMRIKFNAFSK